MQRGWDEYFNGRREVMKMENKFYNKGIEKMMDEGEYYNRELVETL